jgi:pantoate--beta-alanine ligase
VAVFGLKDFQQLVLIRRMVRDLEFGVHVEAGAIVREPDGLAMSSRNAYLDAEERAQARGLHAALSGACEAFDRGERSAAALLGAIRRSVGEYRLLELEYAEAVDPDSLGAVEVAEPGTVLALAALCGSTRLIDNIELG